MNLDLFIVNQLKKAPVIKKIVYLCNKCYYIYCNLFEGGFLCSENVFLKKI